VLNRSQILLPLLLCLFLLVFGCSDASSDANMVDPIVDSGPNHAPHDTGVDTSLSHDTSIRPRTDVAPIVDTTSTPIEACEATAMGQLHEETNSIAFGGHPVNVSALYDPTSHCLTGIDLAFQRDEGCPLTLRFGVQDGIWGLIEAHITSTPECGEGWGSGNTYSAVFPQSKATILNMPQQTPIQADSPSCTNLLEPLQLLGTLRVVSGAKEIDLNLNALGISGAFLSTPTLGGQCGSSPTLCEGLSCGTDPEWGTLCGTCDPETMCADGQCVQASETDKVCTRFNQDRAQLFEGTWNGQSSECKAGSLDEAWKKRALLSVNLYRWVAGLPPLTLNTEWAAASQECALIQHANNGLSHYPSPEWNCYTQNGAAAAGSSNLATTPIVQGIDLFMIDPGNPQTIGHRRWILSNWVSYTAFGSTNGYSCMLTQAAGSGADNAWTAWPAPGVFPFEFNSMGWSSLDQTGWTIQSDSINFSDAQVTVNANGYNQPVIVTKLLSGYGSFQALSIIPDGWKLQTDTSYTVQVAGTEPSIEYTFTTVTCGQ
jgi:hypothetical protein